jgi:hypothetical protein
VVGTRGVPHRRDRHLDADTAARLGIAAAWLTKARLLTFVIGVGSAWARSSPLKHSDDLPPRIDLSKLNQ